ncbi:hypothetical protein [Acidovorax sp. A1169]|uniref:hypothetical protein n=1 Tax=Acidovorax sp. A1169 TaxID=3059524 RepID=UPI002737EB5D|nr:hypothetical protein [Acidovorax sp. A1169]MDP4074373.1 hypothetical protein [Acidovorax sp. A1169]
MHYLKTGLRWCALPVVFVGAVLLGCWMWWVFAHTPMAACPPPLAGYGSDPVSVRCGLLLAARLVLDIGGASMPGLMAVFLCALVAPAQRPAAACAAAIGVCALGLLHFLGAVYARSPMKLSVWANLVALAASPWLTVWLVVHLNQQPQARINPPSRPAGSQSRARS